MNKRQLFECPVDKRSCGDRMQPNYEVFVNSSKYSLRPSGLELANIEFLNRLSIIMKNACADWTS